MRDPPMPNVTRSPDSPDPWRLLEHVPGLLACLTPEGTVLAAFRPMRAELALSAEDAVGMRLWECACWTPWGEVQSRLREAIGRAAAGEGQHLEVPAQAAGRVKWVDLSLSPVPGDAGQVEYLTVCATDVGQRIRAENALRESEGRYRSLMEVLPAAVYACDAQGRITYFNERAVELWGQRPAIGDEDRRFCGSFRLWGSDGRPLPPDLTPMAQAARTGASFRNEEVIVEHPDGRRVHLLINIDALRDADGRVVGAINTFIDITERKRAEQALLSAQEVARQRLAELEDLYRNAPVGLCVLDRDLRFVRINERLAEINGIPAADHIGKTVRELMPELAEAVEQGEREVLETGRPRLGIEVIGETPARPGVQRSWTEQWLPIMDSDGRVTGLSIVVEETTERKKAETLLLEADRRKNQFLAFLAHELRNPLAPIRSAIQILRLRGARDATEMRLQRILDRQLEHLARLVDDLLDVSRITHGKLRLRREPIELAPVLEQVIETTRSFPECRGVELSVTLPDEPVHLEADPVRLSQVFANLLHNACKFTPDGGWIRLRAEREGAQVVVRIEDNGAGIAQADLPRVFELFSQIGPGQADRAGGLGIGLSLVKGLIELHGGSVDVHSPGPGLGTAFTVRLPVTARPASSQQRPAPKPVSTRRILVVDDLPDNLESLAMLLRLSGHEVETAEDGATALECAERYQPEVMLLDIGMPGMDGYEVCRRLRAQPWGQDIRVVALTGWGQEEDRRSTREAGFDAHLVKPVDLAELNVLFDSFRHATGEAPCRSALRPGSSEALEAGSDPV